MGMPDSKSLKWADGFSTDAEPPTANATARVSTAEPAANDADGWEKYRQWVSKAPAPRARRTGIDPALFTWKGYRTWTEQVRRNWTPEPPEDAE